MLIFYFFIFFMVGAGRGEIDRGLDVLGKGE